MSHIDPHITHDLNNGVILAWVHPASPESVKTVLEADEHSDDGRSQFVWLRLPNGDLFLGMFPQGSTYFAVEQDAQYHE